ALPLPLARQVEAAYQRFESAWRAGQRPPIEDHLGSLPEPARTVLLPELLEVELSCRRRAGEIVRPEEYRQRFPEHAALIESIFREQAGEAAGAIADCRLQIADCKSEIANLQSAIVPEWPRDDDGALPPHLGRYRVTARLGAGAFGVVYKAHDDDLRRDVA